MEQFKEGCYQFFFKGLLDFLNGTPTAQQLRDCIDKWDFIKLKSFCLTKEMVTKLKRPPAE
jgi:hypothetical protein